MRESKWPAAPFYPFRHAVTRYHRGHPLRSTSIALLKAATRLSPGLPRSVREIRPLDRPDLSFHPSDSTVVSAIYWFGVCGYEGIMSEVWRTLCRRSQSIVEIGGNIGLFSVIGGKETQGTYTVLEPVPDNATTLRENLARNEIGNVKVLEGAAVPASAMCEVLLNIPDEGHDAPVGAHLSDGVEVNGRSQAKLLKVKGYPMSGLVENCDLLKIDAEGIEEKLLVAAYDILLKNKPTLVIEVLPEAERLAELLKALAPAAGYSIYIVPGYGSDKIVEIDAETFSSRSPRRHRSKDVVLSRLAIENLVDGKTPPLSLTARRY